MPNPRPLRTTLSEMLAAEARLLCAKVDSWRHLINPDFAGTLYAQAARIADLAENAAMIEAQAQPPARIASLAPALAVIEGGKSSVTWDFAKEHQP